MKIIFTTNLLFIVCLLCSYGQTQHYRFEYISNLEYDPTALVQNIQNKVVEKGKINFQVNGLISRTFLHSQDSFKLEVLSFSNIKIDFASNEEILPKYMLKDFSEELQKPIYFKTNLQGSVYAVSLDSMVTSMPTGIILNILSNIQLQTNGIKNGKFQGLEIEPSGEYLFENKIERSELSNCVKLYKTKVRFTKIAGDMQSLGKTDMKVKFLGKYLYDTLAKKIQNLELQESKKFYVKNKLISFSESKFSIKSDSSSKNLEYLPEPGQSYTKWFSLMEDIHTERRFMNKQKNILGTDNFKSILKLIEISDADSSNWNKEAYTKLQALFIVNPNSCNEAKEKLEQDTVYDTAHNLITLALATSGSDCAQDVLLNLILKNRNNTESLNNLLPNLIYLEKPSLRSQKIIEDIAFNSSETDIRKMSLLMLGTITNHVYKYDAKKGDSISRLLINNISNKDIDANFYLLVLGNTGSPLALGLIEPYLANIATRPVAIRSLRFIRLKSVDKLLSNLLRNSKDKKEKIIIKDVIKFRNDLAESQ